MKFSPTLLLLSLFLSTGCLNQVKVDIGKAIKNTFRNDGAPGAIVDNTRSALSASFPIGNKLTINDSTLRGITVDNGGNLYLTSPSNNQTYKLSSSGKTLLTLGTTVGGSSDGEFISPYAATMDSAGKFYIVDKDNNRVQKFNDDGTHIYSLGSSGGATVENFFPTVASVFVDDENNYYITDSISTNSVYKFSSTGQSLMKIGGGSGNYLFSSGVGGVVVDSQKNIYAIDLANDLVQVYDKEGVWLRGIGSGQLVGPSGLAIDSADNIYVSDYTNDHVLKFSSTGTLLATIGTPGNMNGELNGPIGMTVDGAGNLYVCDAINNRIQKFDSSGGHLLTFGSAGAGNGQLSGPKDVAVDSSGNIYVSERDNYRVQKFSPTGTFISYMADDGNYMPIAIDIDSNDNLILGDTYMKLARVSPANNLEISITSYTSNYGEGKFDRISDIATDRLGNIYVADLNNQRIQKFNSAGSFMFMFGSNGVTDGLLSNPNTVAVDGNGNIFVGDDRNRVQKFDSAGNFILSFGTSGSGASMFWQTTDLFIDSSGNVYVTDTFNSYIQKFDNNGNYLSTLGTSGAGQLSSPMQMTIDADGMIIVTDTSKGIVTFNPDGTHALTWRSRGDNDGELADANGMDIDSAGNIYVSDSTNQRIQKFSSTGEHLLTIPTGVTTGVVRVDPAGKIWVMDWYNTAIIKYDIDGTQMLTFGAYGNANGEFENALDMDFDSAGNLYVLDGNLNRIQKFDTNGNYVSKFGTSGSTNGRFNNPSGLVIDINDNLYVTDTGNMRVQKFQLNGAYVSQFAVPTMAYINYIAVDNTGNLYISDSGNYTIEKYDSTGALLMTISGSGTLDVSLGKFAGVNAITLDADGNIYIIDSANNRIQRFDPSGAVFD